MNFYEITRQNDNSLTEHVAWVYAATIGEAISIYAPKARDDRNTLDHGVRFFVPAFFGLEDCAYDVAPTNTPKAGSDIHTADGLAMLVPSDCRTLTI